MDGDDSGLAAAALLKQGDDILQLVQILALLANPFQVPLKPGGCEKCASHYTFSRSSRKER